MSDHDAIGAGYFGAIRRLAEYEVWCNARMFAAAARVEAAEVHRRFAFGLGTMHATLSHIVAVMRKWSGCVGPVIAVPAWVEYDADEPLAALAARSTATGAAFLGAIDASHAAGLLHRERRVEQVFHLVTHGTHHRTQVITMLRLMGMDPPFEAGDFGGWSHA